MRKELMTTPPGGISDKLHAQLMAAREIVSSAESLQARLLRAKAERHAATKEREAMRTKREGK